MRGVHTHTGEMRRPLTSATFSSLGRRTVERTIWDEDRD